MLLENSRATPLSGNALKLIAAVAMLFDHIGVIFFPAQMGWRIVGRFAFPIFAFFIAEGCRYTRNRARYLFTVYLLAILFQLAYSVVSEDVYLSIFVTFSLGISLIYLFDNVKRAVYRPEKNAYQIAFAAILFLLALVGVYLLNQAVLMDYGFYGCITPLCASLFHPPKAAPDWAKKANVTPLSVICMSIPLLLLAFSVPLPVQRFGLLPLLLLLFYSGQRGKYKMKYFFYLFYPLHLVVLYGIALFV